MNHSYRKLLGRMRGAIHLLRTPLLKSFGLLFSMCILLTAQAQQTKISGTVTEKDTGEPLPGVTIQVKGTTNGVISDVDGKFSINVSPNQTLIFSSMGFTNQEVVVKGQTQVNVTMSTNVQELSEVVVTALGIEKKEEKLGYAVSTVNSEAFTVARESNVAYSLQGRVAGLNMSSVNGGPGSTARINLRGLTSFSASSPLFVIDGVPIDNTQRGASSTYGGSDNGDGISNLNPDDIESMTVLKGAAASALYGTRASNGVIVITTKKGKAGQMSVSYNSNLVMSKAIDYTNFQYKYGQGQNGVRPSSVSDALASGALSWGEKMDGAQTIQFDGNSYAYKAQRNNIENFYRTGTAFTNTVSVSKGSDAGTFRLSASNMSNQSILRNSGVSRQTLNLNISQNITDKLTVKALANYVDEKSKNRPYLSDGPLNANNIYWLATSMNQKVLKPGYDVNNDGAEITWSNNIYATNPWFVVNQFVNNLQRSRLIGLASARYDFTDNLFLQVRVGYDEQNDRKKTVTPWGTAYSTYEHGKLDALAHTSAFELNTDVLLGYQKQITSDLSANASVGANMRKNKSEEISISGTPFVLPYFYSYNNVENYSRSYDYSQKQVNSAYYTVDFDYKTFLSVSTTGRYDTYSTLPAGNRGIFTPSVSTSFLFGDLIKVPALSFGKLRASIGQVSGEANQAYLTTQYYSVNSSINGVTTGTFSSSLPNLKLKPFTLTEYEVGTELKFFKNKIGLDIAYFHRQSKNEIISGSISPATGYTTQYIPTGSTRNAGLEMLITATPVSTRNFSWNVSFNYTIVHNKIIDIYGKGSSNKTLTLGTYRPLNAYTALVKGKSGPQIMAYDYLRDGNGNIVVNSSGIPEQGELKSMGSVTPKGYGGLNNSFNYKNWSMAFLIDFKYGNKVLSATNYYAIYDGLHKMTLNGREDGVTTKGVYEDGSTNTSATEAQTYYQGLAQNISRLNVLDGSFIKLRQVTLGYSLPSSVLSKLPFQSVQISFVARNLLTLMRNSPNIDPESSIGSTITYAGIEGGSLPSARSYGFNLNVKF